MVKNLLYRFSVSALIGAAVAGGVVYFTNDRVVKGYRGDVGALMEQQKAAADSLTVLMAGVADRIAASDAVRAGEHAALNERLDRIDARLETLGRTLGVIEYTVNALPDAAAMTAKDVRLQDTLAGLRAELETLAAELKAAPGPAEEQ